MYHYETMTTAINELRKKGYTEDFNLEENCLICNSTKYNPDEFEIHEVYRFEGPSDPADNSIVYGIESKDGMKGVLVNGYGYNSDPLSDAIARKLKIH